MPYGRVLRSLLGLAAAAVAMVACGPDDRDQGAAGTVGVGSTAAATTQVTSGSSGGQRFDVGFAPDQGGAEPSCDDLEGGPPTSLGCVFWTSQVPNIELASGRSYGIAVGNPSAVRDAHVVIEDLRGPGGTLREVAAIDLAPGGSEQVALSGPAGLYPDEDYVPDEPGVHPGWAFRIRSDVPVTATQISPVGGGHVGGHAGNADASLLLPEHALGTVYMGLGYPHFDPAEPGFLVVVATEDGTTVTTPDGEVMLDAFDVLHVATFPEATGVRIDADAEVAVLSGSTCAMVPDAETFACDHLEEMLFPLSSWGTHHVAARHPVRLSAYGAAPETVVHRVVAGTDGVTVTLTPDVLGTGPFVLAKAGDFRQIETTESFVAEATGPIALAQYMTGREAIADVAATAACAPTCPDGDPFMVQSIPTDQFLEVLAFVNDPTYREDAVVIVRPEGAQVSLDCLDPVPDAAFSPVAGTGYEVGTVILDRFGMGGDGTCTDGSHLLTATKPVGIYVFGLDEATSYAHPGGANVGSLWVPPPPEG
ncbi:MAG: hypothetical protein D6705_16695 [Deltaproteobacteria bacterium]|nr:MAG: hypothetical protein D6705_16695 [Deltaproteobacteria bacterium]